MLRCNVGPLPILTDPPSLWVAPGDPYVIQDIGFGAA